MDEKDYTSIVKAKPLFFQRKPSTQQATEACLLIASGLLTLETRKRARKKSDQESFDKAVGHIIGDLLNAAASEHTDWVYRSLNKESFIGGPVGAVTFKAVIHPMMEDGLVVQHKGGNLSNPFTDKTDKAPKYSPGMASRFKATPKLLMKEVFTLITGKLHIKMKWNDNLTKRQLYAHGAQDRDFYLDSVMHITKPEVSKGYQRRMERHKSLTLSKTKGFALL